MLFIPALLGAAGSAAGALGSGILGAAGALGSAGAGALGAGAGALGSLGGGALDFLTKDKFGKKIGTALTGSMVANAFAPKPREMPVSFNFRSIRKPGAPLQQYRSVAKSPLFKGTQMQLMRRSRRFF